MAFTLNTESVNHHHGLPTSMSASTTSSSEFEMQTRAHQTPNVKPPFSFIAMISMAIKNNPKKKASLQEIYKFIVEKFPYYKSSSKGWKNSVRHNLSLNECFIKQPREKEDVQGKGCFWIINPQDANMFDDGQYLKRRKKARVKRSTRSRPRSLSSSPHEVVNSTDASNKTHNFWSPYSSPINGNYRPHVPLNPSTLPMASSMDTANSSLNDYMNGKMPFSYPFNTPSVASQTIHISTQIGTTNCNVRNDDQPTYLPNNFCTPGM